MNHTAYINLGSNLGDRLCILQSAVAAIESRLGAAARRSEPFESEPWGYSSANPYINIGIAITTTLEPPELLAELLDIQRAIDPSPHRDATGAYIDRRIDIDLIAVDELTLSLPELTLPHPRMHLREFVMTPMAELAPAWRHPILGLTAAQISASLTANIL